MTSPIKAHALYLFEHYRQSGENKGFTDMLYQRIVKTENLKLWEAKALANEFNKICRNASQGVTP